MNGKDPDDGQSELRRLADAIDRKSDDRLVAREKYEVRQCDQRGKNSRDDDCDPVGAAVAR
jgi:hypothetical protein